MGSVQQKMNGGISVPVPAPTSRRKRAMIFCPMKANQDEIAARSAVKLLSRARRPMLTMRRTAMAYYRARPLPAAPPRAFNARRTFSGVIGSSSMRTPTALKIALATAGSTGLAHISPGPLAP
jgi:hypothetical protein